MIKCIFVIDVRLIIELIKFQEKNAPSLTCGALINS